MDRYLKTTWRFPSTETYVICSCLQPLGRSQAGDVNYIFQPYCSSLINFYFTLRTYFVLWSKAAIFLLEVQKCTYSFFPENLNRYKCTGFACFQAAVPLPDERLLAGLRLFGPLKELVQTMSSSKTLSHYCRFSSNATGTAVLYTCTFVFACLS